MEKSAKTILGKYVSRTDWPNELGQLSVLFCRFWFVSLILFWLIYFASTYIPEGEHIMYMGEPVHPWHYNCYSCGWVL